MLRTTIIIMLLLSGCAGESAEDLAAEKARTAELRAEIVSMEKQIKEMEAAEKPVVAKAPTAIKISKAEAPKKLESEQAQGWCYKDYCPCDPNPDNDAAERLHCDMMETGGPVDSQLLAISRANREVRRQLRTGDY